MLRCNTAATAYLTGMSKQLALSAALSVMAMVAVVTLTGQPKRETGAATLASAPAQAISMLTRIAQ